MRRQRGIVVMLVWVSVVGLVVAPGAAQSPPQRTLIIGTKEAPPFAMKNPDGTWSGVSIELWQALAAELQLAYELREFDLKGLLEGVKAGTLDAAVAALTITAEREKVMDFTHPFYTTGLGIAVSWEQRGNWLRVAERFVSWQFLQVVAALTLLLFIAGAFVWLFERRRNPSQLGERGLKGVWSGFWWAAVTMTTVGYGDKAPITVGGRLVTLIWMFTAIIVISGFTAAITTALTVDQLQSSIRGPQDLVRVRVASVPESTSAGYLRDKRILPVFYPTPLEGMQAVARGEADAMVYDAPLLRYLATTSLRGAVRVLPNTFEPQDYGIALPAGSPLREPINRVLLEKVRQPAWQDILFQYLGK